MSELKPNETDVCCECGSTNLDYEELHAEVPDKKGYARLEQEVCYCCDCFAIQSEDAQAAEIERLKAKVAELETDNARMREALGSISYDPIPSKELITWEHGCEYYRQTAIKALKGEG